MANLRQEELRGAEAKQILDSEIYQEAYAAIRDRIVGQLEGADLPDDRRKKLNDLLVAHKKARQYMESVLMTGTMAGMEIDRQASLAERAAAQMKRVFS